MAGHQNHPGNAENFSVGKQKSDEYLLMGWRGSVSCLFRDIHTHQCKVAMIAQGHKWCLAMNLASKRDGTEWVK